MTWLSFTLLHADFILIINSFRATGKIIIQLTRDVTELSNKLRFNMIHKNIIQNRNEKTLDGPQVSFSFLGYTSYVGEM